MTWKKVLCHQTWKVMSTCAHIRRVIVRAETKQALFKIARRALNSTETVTGVSTSLLYDSKSETARFHQRTSTGRPTYLKVVTSGSKRCYPFYYKPVMANAELCTDDGSLDVVGQDCFCEVGNDGMDRNVNKNTLRRQRRRNNGKRRRSVPPTTSDNGLIVGDDKTRDDNQARSAGDFSVKGVGIEGLNRETNCSLHNDSKETVRKTRKRGHRKTKKSSTQNKLDSKDESSSNLLLNYNSLEIKPDLAIVSNVFKGNSASNTTSEILLTDRDSTEHTQKLHKGAFKRSNLEGNKSDSSIKKSKPPRPNFFVAVRIKEKGIVKKVKELQDGIISADKAYEKALVPIQTLHITLLVFHAKDVEEENNARRILAECRDTLVTLCQQYSTCLSFEGVGNFRNEVVYVSLNECSGKDLLSRMATEISQSFKDNGIQLTSSKETFKPHLTALKLSRNFKFFRRMNIKKIPEGLYKDFETEKFGTDNVTAVLLCSMTSKNDDGFYKCIEEVDLTQSPTIYDKYPLKAENETLTESWDNISILQVNKDVDDLPDRNSKEKMKRCNIL